MHKQWKQNLLTQYPAGKSLVSSKETLLPGISPVKKLSNNHTY